jgi:hypothetical protein
MNRDPTNWLCSVAIHRANRAQPWKGFVGVARGFNPGAGQPIACPHYFGHSHHQALWVEPDDFSVGPGERWRHELTHMPSALLVGKLTFSIDYSRLPPTIEEHRLVSHPEGQRDRPDDAPATTHLGWC